MRTLVPAPLAARTGISPLQQYVALREGRQRVNITGRSSRRIALLPFVTLDCFDGTYWTTDESVNGVAALAGVVRSRPRSPQLPDLAARSRGQGAWRETLDRHAESGIRAGRQLTSGQVALGAPPSVRDNVAALGALLDRAGYAPEHAGAAMPDMAWACATRVAATLRMGRSSLRRMLVVIDPRPLWRR